MNFFPYHTLDTESTPSDGIIVKVGKLNGFFVSVVQFRIPVIDLFGREPVAIYLTRYILLIKVFGLWRRCAVQRAALELDQSIAVVISDYEIKYCADFQRS